MVDFPEVTIVVCTYDRYEEIRKTVEALIDLVCYPKDKLRLIVADDSSPGSYVSRLKRLVPFKHFPTEFVKTPENCGWGCNVNTALAQVETPYVFFIEDDYILSQPLDLRLGVALMETKPHIGMVRYRGTAGDRVVLHQFEFDTRPYLDDFRYGMGLPHKQTYFLLDSGSPSLYLYSHGAHLKHTRFHEFYGPYPEGRKLGETEEAYAHIVKGKMREDSANAPAIAILPEWIAVWFDHIGQSYQHTELDR